MHLSGNVIGVSIAIGFMSASIGFLIIFFDCANSRDIEKQLRARTRSTEVEKEVVLMQPKDLLVHLEKGDRTKAMLDGTDLHRHGVSFDLSDVQQMRPELVLYSHSLSSLLGSSPGNPQLGEYGGIREVR